MRRRLRNPPFVHSVWRIDSPKVAEVGDHLLRPLLREKDAAPTMQQPLLPPPAPRGRLTHPVLGSARFFMLRASPCSPAGMLPLPHALVPWAAVFPPARFAAGWYGGLTPSQFTPWLNALQFYSSNRVLGGTSSPASRGTACRIPSDLFSAGYLQRGCPIACARVGSAGAVPGWSQPAPGIPRELRMCFKCESGNNF